MNQTSVVDHKKNCYSQDQQEFIDKGVEEVRKSSYLPGLHIYPKIGLMNDPNGLAYFNDKYYVFFQWYPFAPVHGLKHWGKTTSTDLIHWSTQELALIPDREFEKNGCYSGNAIEHDDKLYLFYTANYKTPEGKIPKQALAVMDKDENITKFPTPILSSGIPGLSGELRDPFVFQRDGKFYMLLGGSQFTGDPHHGFGEKGVLVLYQSLDLIHWDYDGLIDLPIETGYMLECPSIITIDGKDVLFLSPMGLEKEEDRFHNRFASIYLIGRLDLYRKTFTLDSWDELDAGFDFYAPQAFLGKNKQPMMMGWFGCGEPTYPVQEEWKHGLTFPQKIFFEDNQLKRFPVDEICHYFKEKTLISQSSISLSSKTYHLELTNGFHFRVGSEDDYWEFGYDSLSGKAVISRKNLTKIIDPDFGMERSTVISPLKKLDLFADHSFVELYLNNGEKVFSFHVFQEEVGKIVSQSDHLEGTLSLPS